MTSTRTSLTPSEIAELTPAATALRDGARSHPDQPAIDVDDTVLSYRELDAAVDALAQRLLDDLGDGHPFVGMRLADTRAMVTATIAVQRAGMVAVPIDPTAPLERVRAVLGEIDLAVLLSDVPGDDDELPVAVLHPLAAGAAPPGEVQAAPGDLAAVVFTSGSTGTPKGIVQPTAHRARRSRMISDLAGRYPLGERRFGSIAVGTMGAADSLVHASFALGGTFVAYEIRRHGLSGFADWLRERRVSVLMMVPTVWRYLARELASDVVFPDLRIVLFIGETSTWEDVTSLRAHMTPDSVVSNMFGQTEVAISSFDITADTPVGVGPLPAGCPLPNRTVSVVNEDGEPVPAGEAGEIVVDTDDCALGYWRLPEQTARVFVPLPDGRRRVRTGDRGRMAPDGTLEHLGRLDHIVKVAGNRIELGEVESALRAIPGVSDAAATTYASADGDTRLVAYAVAAPGAQLHPAGLRAALARRLPGPTVPDHVDVLAELPRLAGGKVDRRALPPPTHDRRGQDQPAEQPASQLQAALLALWQDVLEIESIGVHDDFFELGGDSMRAARLFAGIERQFGMDRPVSLILDAPTVSALAAALGEEATWPALIPLQLRGGRAPLFVVHDGHGDVFYARRLTAQLGDEQPVYGLRPRRLEPEAMANLTAEAVAASYVEEIRSVRPHGPYLLYGFSLGGIIAFEMARILRSAGEPVTLLAMGDTTAPLPELAGRRPNAARRAAMRTRQLRDLDPADAARWAGWLAARQARHIRALATQRLGEATGRREPTAEVRVERLAATGEPVPPELRGPMIMHYYGAMAYRYQPTSRYDGSVLLIRAHSRDPRPDRGWTSYITGDVQVVDVDAAHNLLHTEPAATAVGIALRQAIDAVTDAA